jgi:hypothetical protein
VAPHDLFLAWIEAAGLVENRQGNTGFADVMKGCCQSEPLHIRTGEADIQREADGHSGYQQAMLERAFMIAAHVVKPRAKSVLRDAIDDLRCGLLGV